MNFVERFPFASSAGVLSSVGFEDIKPILVVFVAFFVDLGLKSISNKVNKNKKDGDYS